MVTDNYLKVGGKLGDDALDEPEYSQDSFAVGVSGGDACALSDLGRVVRLRWLVEHQEARDWPTLPDEVSVQCQVANKVIADMVLSAADTEQRCWAGLNVSDDSKASEIKTDIGAAVLELEVFGVTGHITANGE